MKGFFLPPSHPSPPPSLPIYHLMKRAPGSGSSATLML
jgi:hypothetical protein